jgi:hypothetical protein
MSYFLKLYKERIFSFLRDPLHLKKWMFPYFEADTPNRISARLGSGGYRWVGQEPRLDVHMFVQDMYSGIMPFTHIVGQGREFVARLESSDPQLTQLVAQGLTHRGYRNNLADSLTDFVRTCAQSLFVYGKCIYEIVIARDEVGKIAHLEFANVYPLSMVRLVGHYYQLIPWWVAKHSHVKVGIRRIPKDKILHIEFPRELGGRRKLKHIIRRLSSLSGETIPSFQMKALENYENTGFDLNKYTSTKYLEKAQLTKSLGWNQRGALENNILEYYSMYRRLNFSLSQAIIREHILDRLNQALIGSLLDLNTRIVVTGIPKSDDIRREFERLASGNLSFADLVKGTSLR